MVVDPLVSPVVVDGIVSEEKIAELLALQTEYPELDYKMTIDLTAKSGEVELAKDVGAMRVRGGYILGGVDGQGGASGLMDACDRTLFDEARLVPKMAKYLVGPLQIRTNIVERDGHVVVAICVLPSPEGCSFFRVDGKYEKKGNEVVVFREGDVFWRDGTRSARIGRDGLEEVIRRRVQRQKDSWIDEQQEIRRRERTELEEAYRTRRLGEGPLGSVNLDLDPDELNLAVLDLIRRGDTVATHHVMRSVVNRAHEQIVANDVEDGLGDTLDKLTCLTATFMEYRQDDWLDEAISTLVAIYAMPLTSERDVRWFGYRSRISREEAAPRVWLAIVERVFGLGALAVRREAWDVARQLAVQLPRPWVEDGYESNWLRHALTMASRAQQFEREEGQNVSLLSLARGVISRLHCLRPDGVSADDDVLLTSLAEFDVLANLAAVAAARSIDGSVFYPNFARFRQGRVQPIVNRLLTDQSMRDAIFPLDDEDLAVALAEIGNRAASEGWRFDGFVGWDQTPVAEFIEQNLPDAAPDED